MSPLTGRLVAGIDSSTQSCKVVVRDAQTGRLVRSGQARHPDGTEVDPEAWWVALQEALTQAGGLDDVAAVAVGGQQHGLVALDAEGRVVRPALLWNDTRSAQAAADLVAELGDGDVAAGRRAWVEAIGSVPVASLTVTKLRWLAEHEPDNAARVAAVALPHDWLTWRLAGTGVLTDLVTDRSDASGTGYFDPATDTYRRDLLALALGREDVVLPRVLGPSDVAGRVGGTGALLGPGAGDNAAAALGVGMGTGHVTISLGTSGVVSAVAADPVRDPSGLVTGFADATGNFLPMATTLNASRVLDATARLLGVDHAGLSELALAAEPGAGGLVHVPYLDGERTPNLPQATGSLRGMTRESMTRENLARAAVEGMLCHLAEGMAAVQAQGVDVRRISLIGGAARSAAVQAVAPAVLGQDVELPEPGEYVADGAARQAAWVLSGAEEPPAWEREGTRVLSAQPTPEVRERYRAEAALVLEQFTAG
ncbi:xylulokinase [Georgenia sp. 311]|uniref:xylulokinase n=1 Tax=Georgenia sp. 311 TaxID=2585134 RepID=UPI0011120CF7|nr:xylulokinase [Georgenia sp. 311]TNC20860.1 xylulokinase [Georgenia sp. 311]